MISFNYYFRKTIAPKMSKYENFHNYVSKIYSYYCNLSGNFHVLPDFYILGGQKCGTTSLFLYLLEHPNILSPTAKDIRFFDKYFSKGINWYKMYFPTKFENFFKSLNLTGEATERYLDHPHASSRISTVTPKAKFIILLRNPVDRAFSHYTMIVKHGQEKNSFLDAIKNEKNKIFPIYEKMVSNSEYYDDLYFRHGYLHRGLYILKLKRWMEVFPREQFLIIQSEDFFTNTKNIYNKILKFLELPAYDLEFYQPYRKQDYDLNQLEPNIRNELNDFFKPYNEQLFELLGMKFNWN